MKHKRILALALAVCLCLSILPGAAWETTSGTIGESHVSWSFDETSGRLTISGSGGMPAYSRHRAARFLNGRRISVKSASVRGKGSAAPSASRRGVLRIRRR